MPPPPPPLPNPQNQPNFFQTVLNTNASAGLPTTTSNTPPRPKPPRPHPPSTSAAPSTITPAQRSQQARNKPFASPTAGESYELRQRREQASNILGSTELLMWYSAARNESLAQTRRHYQNIVLGLGTGTEAESVLWREEWEVPVEQRVRKEGEDVVMGGSGIGSPARSAKGKEKAKKRG